MASNIQFKRPGYIQIGFPQAVCIDVINGRFQLKIRTQFWRTISLAKWLERIKNHILSDRCFVDSTIPLNQANILKLKETWIWSFEHVKGNTVNFHKIFTSSPKLEENIGITACKMYYVAEMA